MESKRTRNIKKNFWFNKEENNILLNKSKLAGMNASDYIRKIVLGYELKEKPDDKFYEQIKLLKSIAHNMNQIAIKSHKLGFIDEIEYAFLSCDENIIDKLIPNEIGYMFSGFLFNGQSLRQRLYFVTGSLTLE